jgi:cell division protein FtsZ
MVATEMALNNPLIDEYSLQGAKGLLVNITGSSDLKLFEVDQAVNKIRAEVDPEAELIFGAIKDQDMNGKIRVSIVATALDGQKPESKTVLNMVSRIQNRNTGYSESLFPKNTHIERNTLNSINGANALKLDESYQTNQNTRTNLLAESEPDPLAQIEVETDMNPEVSIESASYIENTSQELGVDNTMNQEENTDEYTPQLFDENKSSSNEEDDTFVDENNGTQNESLFDTTSAEEEDFEIPAFLRKQKF